MFDLWRKRRVVRGKGVGLTLIDLMVVVCVIGVVAAIAIPLHANAQARARIEKAQSDMQMLASAVRMYVAHMGTLPLALTVLTSVAVNGQNQRAGPFMESVPAPPPGGTPMWGAYGYTSSTVGTFSITATGDGTTIVVP